jgi:hypothetical protein
VFAAVANFCSVPETVPLDTVTEDRRYIYKILAAIYLLFQGASRCAESRIL